MTKPYEKPTDELRQVKHGYKEWNREVIQYYTIQRKWLVRDSSVEGDELTFKEEWRDLPVVEDKDL